MAALADSKDEFFMNAALVEAEQAAAEGEIPVGAVVVQDGKMIAAAHNRREQDTDATAHAEMLALQRACQKLNRWRLNDCTLYVTLEPCPMCAGALWNARIGRIVYGAWDSAAGACGSLFNIPGHPALLPHPDITAGIKEKECREILQRFLREKRKNKT